MGSYFPVQLTRFIGRQREMAEVKKLLAGTRLLTLTGPGGSGKTRLAIEVARQLEDGFKDGIVWVELASLSEDTLVTQIVAGALDVRKQPGRELESSLISFLGHKQLLLMLDNCEHLIAACALLVDRLLRGCPYLSIIATSLEPLRVAGETAWAVPPLSIPDSGPIAADSLQQYDAAKLFLDRTRSVSPDFALTSANAAAIGRICRRLDGLPLAIELAASRANVLTAQQIADRLDDRFALLISDTRATAQPRHQTLRATIDWSYGLLATDEQRLLQRVAVFEGGFTLEAAEAICADDVISTARILELLSALAAKSLVSADTIGRTYARYRLLESVRAYALEELHAAGQENDIRDHHLSYYVFTVEEAAPNLIVTYQRLWFNWLLGEQDDIRAALRWSLKSKRIEDGLRIINALGRSQYWAELSYVQEWQHWLAQLLAKTTAENDLSIRLEALTNVTSFCGLLGHGEMAIKHGKQAIAVAEELGDRRLLAPALNSLSRAYAVGGDYQTAYQLNQRSVDLHRQEGEWVGMAFTMLNLAMDAIALGRFDDAKRHLDECLLAPRSSQTALLEAHTYSIIGELEFCRQDYVKALSAYQTSLPILRQANAERDIAAVILRLGYTYLQLGDHDQARLRFIECLELQEKTGNQQGMAECLTAFGAVAYCQGSPEDAVMLLSAAASLTKGPHVSLYPTIRFVNEHYLSSSRQELVETAYLLALEKGSQLSLDQALELAKQRLALRSSEDQNPSRLTPRQQEVAALIAQGKSNGQIAESLVLSKRTVEKHVANILAALEMENRSEIIRWAIENRLIGTSSH